MSADKTDGGVRALGFNSLSDFAVVLQRRRGGMDDDVIVVFGLGKTGLDVDIVGRAIHQLAVWNERGGLREPGWIPKGADLALGLVTGASAAVKTIKGRWAEKKSLHR